MKIHVLEKIQFLHKSVSIMSVPEILGSIHLRRSSLVFPLNSVLFTDRLFSWFKHELKFLFNKTRLNMLCHFADECICLIKNKIIIGHILQNKTKILLTLTFRHLHTFVKRNIQSKAEQYF